MSLFVRSDVLDVAVKTLGEMSLARYVNSLVRFEDSLLLSGTVETLLKVDEA